MADYPDYEGGKSKLFSVADWAALEATDKNFSSYDSNKARDLSTLAIYTVPTGKTLYITGFSFEIFSYTATDYDHFFYGDFQITTPTLELARFGGIGGGFVSLRKPIVVSAGTALNFKLVNRSNLAANLGLTVWGYEA